MAETSFSNIPQSYYISNKKIYTGKENSYKISNVQKFDAEKFSKNLKSVFAQSSLKTIAALATAVKSNPATMSRLYNGASQTNTAKPSQPSKGLVIRIAEYFEQNVDEWLMLAGYAPQNTNTDAHEILEGVTVIFQNKKMSKAEQEQILTAMRMVAAGAKAQSQTAVLAETSSQPAGRADAQYDPDVQRVVLNDATLMTFGEEKQSDKETAKKRKAG